MRNVAFLILWTCFLVGMGIAGSEAEELPLRDTPEGKVFGTDRFAVRLDPATGWATDVLCDGQCIVNLPETRQVFDLKDGDRWVTGSGAPIEGCGIERLGPDAIRSCMKVGDWSIAVCVQLLPDQRMLRRWFEIAWNGAGDRKIKGFWFQGGQFSLGEQGSYFCPGHYPPHRVAAGELVAGRKDNAGPSPHPILADNGDGWSALWMLDESRSYSDRGSSGLTQSEDAIRVTYGLNVLGYARPGVTQQVGDGWLWLRPNDAETALRRMPEWFRVVGQTTPEGRPDWLKRVVLYSFHPGGTIGSQCRDLGGFQPATELLDHINRLGCNAIWLMPLEDKSIYWPRDYYKFQEGLGTPDDYKALTAKAHALGMRVWQDCVPHGGSNEFPRAKQHPEWLAQNEDGSTLHYWCFDFNWPTWLDYMSDVVTFYTREYGLDGFRIDACGGSKIPNWNPAIPYARASHAQLQGGLAMQRALRKAVRAVRPDGANLAEVGGSIHGTVSDSTYDFALCYHVMHDFRRTPAGMFVQNLRRWLHEQQYAEAPDLVRMRHLESHDSLRSSLWYGARPQRALVALIAWIHGIPMVYHEMEDGHFDAYRTIFYVRRHVPELSHGAADYLSVTAAEGVFACLRTGAVPTQDSTRWRADYAWDTSPKCSERASVVLVNLNGQPVNGEVSLSAASLPEPLRDAQSARDLMTGETLPARHDSGALKLAVELPPFGYTVLRLDSAKLPALPPLPCASDKQPVQDKPLPAEHWEIATESGSLRIDPATGLASAWQKDGQTLAGPMDLALPADMVQTDTKAVCRKIDDGIEVTRSFGPSTLKLRYSPSPQGGVEVRAVWEGDVPGDAAIVFDTSGATAWQVQTAEGLFASPFRVRHPECDGVVGSIYRLPQGTAVLWDSRQHPFGLSSEHAWLAAVSAQGQAVFVLDPSCLPGYVQVLERIGSSHGMKVLMAWRNREDGIDLGNDEIRFHLTTSAPAERADDLTGDRRLQLVGGGWEFQNTHYRARVARTGALAGLWRKEGDGWQPILQNGGVYTDRGFGSDVRYAQENDVEASARWERHGSQLKLCVHGAMRGFGRFEKMYHPVRFYCEYTFDDEPAFRYACAVQPETAPAGDYAFLSLLLQTEGANRITFTDAEGVFLTGQCENRNERFAQLAKSTAPQRLPTDLRLLNDRRLLLHLGEIAWLGVKPQNVFMHGDDLHLAWMDGNPQQQDTRQWSGITCSIACEDAVAKPADQLPLVVADEEALLRNGSFDSAGACDVVLLSTGQRLGRRDGGDDAWTLPPHAAYVTEDGNRCAMVEGDGQSYRLIRQTLPFKAFEPGSKWRLSARMKGQAVEPGDPNWKTAALRWAVSVDGSTQYATASLPNGDSDWQTIGVELTVPDGAIRVAVEAGLNGNKGRVWIDDVRIERLDGPSARR